MNDLDQFRAERIDELGMTVRWPDSCCRCGTQPAPHKRWFQIPTYNAAEVVFIAGSEYSHAHITPPLCARCYSRSRGPLAFFSRIFDWWHKLAVVQDGRLVFANESFNKEFQALNRHLVSDGGFGQI